MILRLACGQARQRIGTGFLQKYLVTKSYEIQLFPSEINLWGGNSHEMFSCEAAAALMHLLLQVIPGESIGLL